MAGLIRRSPVAHGDRDCEAGHALLPEIGFVRGVEVAESWKNSKKRAGSRS
jgi:hypothetical protein